MIPNKCPYFLVLMDSFLLKNICTKYSILFGETKYTLLAEKKHLPGRVLQAFPCSMDGKVKMTLILPHRPNIHLLDDKSSNQISSEKIIGN